MELFLARNHSALTHLPIASAILLALCACAALFTMRKEIAFAWAALSILAFVTVLPTLATGVMAAKGRFNDEGKPYITSGIVVSSVPANTRIREHQLLGAGGSVLSFLLACFGVTSLRGKSPNKYLIALLAVILAVAWGIGGHLGGSALWGPDTFPVFNR